MHENENKERCPVQLHKAFAQRRPEDCNNSINNYSSLNSRQLQTISTIIGTESQTRERSAQPMSHSGSQQIAACRVFLLTQPFQATLIST